MRWTLRPRPTSCLGSRSPMYIMPVVPFRRDDRAFLSSFDNFLKCPAHRFRVVPQNIAVCLIRDGKAPHEAIAELALEDEINVLDDNFFTAPQKGQGSHSRAAKINGNSYGLTYFYGLTLRKCRLGGGHTYSIDPNKNRSQLLPRSLPRPACRGRKTEVNNS